MSECAEGFYVMICDNHACDFSQLRLHACDWFFDAISRDIDFSRVMALFKCINRVFLCVS